MCLEIATVDGTAESEEEKAEASVKIFLQNKSFPKLNSLKRKLVKV